MKHGLCLQLQSGETSRTAQVKQKCLVRGAALVTVFISKTQYPAPTIYMKGLFCFSFQKLHSMVRKLKHSSGKAEMGKTAHIMVARKWEENKEMGMDI